MWDSALPEKDLKLSGKVDVARIALSALNGH
jgi:hypothetical protein